MCRLIVNCLIITACVSVVYSAVARLLPVEKPPEFAGQEGCYVPSLNKVLPYSVPYSPKDKKGCVQYMCNTDNITVIFTCGAIALQNGCERKPGDLSLPYPDCCDTVACNNVDR